MFCYDNKQNSIHYNQYNVEEIEFMAIILQYSIQENRRITLTATINVIAYRNSY